MIEQEVARRSGRLRVYNVVMGGFHLVQGLVILWLSNGFSLPVTGTFLDGPPGAGTAQLHHLFDLPIGPALACFLFISAAAHTIISLPGVFPWYCRNLAKKRNDARWIEYSLSASLMIVIIAMLTGISDVAALVALFGVNAAMILFGMAQEHAEQPGEGRMLPFWLGCIAGAVPWIAIGVYLAGPASPPGFVYGIYFSLFAFFNIFALNMWLQYRRAGPWRNYLFGESVYILLSLTAKSLLAWQVFVATLMS